MIRLNDFLYTCAAIGTAVLMVLAISGRPAVGSAEHLISRVAAASP